MHIGPTSENYNEQERKLNDTQSGTGFPPDSINFRLVKFLLLARMPDNRQVASSHD